MLVLTRKTGEGIQIGNDIVVSVVWTSGQRVRLAIDAPRNVSIRREELLKTVITECEHEPRNQSRHCPANHAGT
jgi:carbon storage regulator